MKLNTIYKYTWNCQVWILEADVNDPNGTERYVLNHEQECNLATGVAQSVLFSPKPIPYGALVRHIKNASGEEPFFIDTFEQLMYVNSLDPLLDIYGKVRGYRQVIRRTQPVEFRGLGL